MNDAEFLHWEAAMRRMLPALLKFMGEDTTTTSLARMYRGLYEALLREGFTPHQALMITSGHRPTAQANASGGGL
ncbi:MAG: hypothetical protein ACR2M1_05635 [Gemmatimonadaceae bacterium]